MAGHPFPLLPRRSFLANLLSLGVVSSIAPPYAAAAASKAWPTIDATFLFTADVHTCLISGGVLSPNCAQEGKTDANLLRHVAALNRIAEFEWPTQINGVATGLGGAGKKIATPLGLVIGGDMTDDGGGQVKVPGEGHQLLQFFQPLSGRCRTGPGAFPCLQRPWKPRSRPGRRSTTYRLVSPRAARLCRAQSSPDGVLQATGGGWQLRYRIR